jgi:XRE family transcriptional regulator, fatty acid utilization regulator
LTASLGGTKIKLSYFRFGIMAVGQENIRLIFGIKIRQLRQEKKISLSELAQKAGLSVSYLNEIEKGKKYPKTEKIFALAQALSVDYDSLVSLKLSRKLEPLATLFNSTILTDLPLEIFGVEPGDLFDLLSEAPTKLSAFINTIIEIGRSYDLKVEDFYFSVLRSYQAMHDNYFPDLEEQAEIFLADQQVPSGTFLDEKWLQSYLQQTYGYVIEDLDDEQYTDLREIRSVFHKKNQPTLYLNRRLTPQQRAFTFAREIGYHVLGIKSRPHISSVPVAMSFEEVLNNFRASYFAGAILVSRTGLVPRLTQFFARKKWEDQAFLDIMEGFCCTAEVFLQRMTNLLPSHFGINELFFFRFQNRLESELYYLVKELHLARLHIPHGTAFREHYCRRWVSITVLKEWVELAQKTSAEAPAPPTLVRAQLSTYIGTDNRYFVIALATPSSLNGSLNSSLTLGLALDEQVQEKIQFLNDESLQHRYVGETCERCGALDCVERIKPPSIWQKFQRIQSVKNAAEQLK